MANRLRVSSLRNLRWLGVLALCAIGHALPASGVAFGQDAPAKSTELKTKEVVYRQTPQGEMKLTLFFPSDAEAAAPRPAVVFFFGGGWKQGQTKQFREQAEYLARRGLITATADYRVASRHNTLPDAAVEDAQHAVRWLRTQAKELGIDPQRIAAAGGSAGGHLAACTALLDEPAVVGDAPYVSSRPNALVLFNPVLDLAGLNLPGKTIKGELIVEALSPVKFVRDDLPPTVMFFGSNDKYLEGAERYQAKALRHKGRCDLYVADGESHSFFNRQPWKATTLKAADEFLGSLGWLAGPPTLAAPEGGFRELAPSNVKAAVQSRSTD